MYVYTCSLHAVKSAARNINDRSVMIMSPDSTIEMNSGKIFLVLLLAASYAVGGPIDCENISVAHTCGSSVLLCVANFDVSLCA